MRRTSLLVSAALAASLVPTLVLAAPGRSGGGKTKFIDPTAVDSVEVQFKVGKKGPTVTKSIHCFNGAPGTAREGAKGMTFLTFGQQLKKLRAADAAAKKVKMLQVLMKQGGAACANAGEPPPFEGTPPSGAPAPSPTPVGPADALSMEPYTGTFGETEARLLYDRFAFGGSPDEIAAAVASGMEATIARLTSVVAQPELTAVEDDLICDGRLSTDPQNRNCDPAKRNDLSLTGLRYAQYYRILRTQTPFFEKLFLFLHDERIAVSSAVVQNCERFAMRDYVNKVRRAAYSGDYIQYMRDLNDDHIAHLRWLDGGVNRSFAPNENFAREFWELGTVAASSLAKTANYTNRDIAQSALAFTGWNIVSYQINGENVCLPSFVPGFHAQGSFTIFENTPYQAQVNTAEDVLRASFINPATANSLAVDTIDEFIRPDAPQELVEAIARKYRENNFNMVETMRSVMRSKALYSTANRKQLIKHPWDLVFGFLRTSKIPVSLQTLDTVLSRLDQRPLLAPTVFGWDPKRLAGEAYVLEWRNQLIDILSIDEDDWKEDYGYDFHAQFLGTLPTSTSPAQVLTDRLSGWLNAPLNQAQRDILTDYLNFDLQYCYNTAQCGGQQYQRVRNAFDPHPESRDWSRKLREGLIQVALLDSYRLK